MMDGLQLSQQARQVLFLAREAALKLQHDHVGTDHGLLGLLDVAGPAQSLLDNFGGGIGALRSKLQSQLKSGQVHLSDARDLPLTKEAGEWFAFAAQEAGQDQCINTEHLLLGLIRVESGIATEFIREMGINRASIDRARHDLIAERRDRSEESPALQQLRNLQTFLRDIDAQVQEKIKELSNAVEPD